VVAQAAAVQVETEKVVPPVVVRSLQAQLSALEYNKVLPKPIMLGLIRYLSLDLRYGALMVLPY
jgi:hypothetical protein